MTVLVELLQELSTLICRLVQMFVALPCSTGLEKTASMQLHGWERSNGSPITEMNKHTNAIHIKNKMALHNPFTRGPVRVKWKPSA